MGYVLENSKEYERLEKQSELAAYDYQTEFAGLNAPKGTKILDAGCGSGVVSRFLAKKFPKTQVVGCDFSANRLEYARFSGQSQKNLSFREENLASLSFEDGSFDFIVCRYVVEHLTEQDRVNALSEFFRVLKPTGKLIVVDFDGLLYNTYPVTPRMNSVFDRIRASGQVDLDVGRKIPALLKQTGFRSVNSKIQVHLFQEENMADEIRMVDERLMMAKGFFLKILGSENEFSNFHADCMKSMKAPGATVFYNKFIVEAQKS